MCCSEFKRHPCRHGTTQTGQHVVLQSNSVFFSPCKGSVMLTRGQACPRLHNRHPSGLWSWSLHWLELRAPHFGLYLGGVSESATATCAVVIRTRKQILACYLGCGSDAEGFCRRTGGSSHSSSASLPRKVPRRHRRQKPWRGHWRMLWIHRHAFITAIHENRSLSASRFEVGKESKISKTLAVDMGSHSTPESPMHWRKLSTCGIYLTNVDTLHIWLCCESSFFGQTWVVAKLEALGWHVQPRVSKQSTFVWNESLVVGRTDRKYIVVKKSVAGSVVKLSQSAGDQMSYLTDSLVQPVWCCRTPTFVMNKI